MRDNLARKLAWPMQEVATVVGVSGRGLRLRSSSGEFEARRAASCLLEPALGDEVLVAHHERGSHALAVLERDDATAARLSVEGDLEIAAASGRLSVSGRDGVDVVTPGEAAIAAGSARLQAGRADAVVGVLSLLGDSLTAKVDRVKTVAQSVETVAERLVQRLDRAYRFIARSEVVRAEYLEFEARAAFHVKAETTLVNSGGLTKIDGSQIHLG
ncbi:DUF3540 domain-containing protein [Sorangium cellulosum]|uniref:DUF3540 domain-containing protein n=1 Tax=Sorangium cellulosum TaxID=56 RepID=A0A150QQV3_SORCE|nr:DUF3540 domain-containing protein [Sorangium cellulosum]KYF70212.1 hypothetical protein BE15_28260 [Sorangium cellulosum]